MVIDIWAIYLPLSLTPILPLVLTGVVHALPSTVTSLHSTSRAGPLGISLLCLEIVRSGKTLLSHQVLSGIRRDSLSKVLKIMCEVDAVLTAYLFTALIAHLPIITYSLLKSRPTPSVPRPRTPRALYLIPIIYVYALIPTLPILADAGINGFTTDRLSSEGNVNIGSGFGKWWGFYCVEMGPWWRIVRPITLLPPLLLTLPLALTLFATLYSNFGHPSQSIRPSKRSIFAAVLLFVLALSGIAFLVVEQVIGWKADWWPRVFEVLPTYIIMIIYASYSGVWRTCISWIRFKRATPSSDPLTSDDSLSPSDPFLTSKPRRPTSSFYPPPTPPRMFRSSSTRQLIRTPSPDSRDGDDEKGIVPSLQMRYFTESIFSVDSTNSPPTPHLDSKFSSSSTLTVNTGAMRLPITSTGPSAWRAGPSNPVDLIERQQHTRSGSRNTLKSFLGRLRSSVLPTNQSSPRSPSFPWSVTDNDDSRTPQTSLHRPPTSVFPDDASSVSRYSLTSYFIPRATRDSYLDTHTSKVGDFKEKGAKIGEARIHDIDRGRIGRGDAGGPKNDRSNWVYPEEVFVDFRDNEVVREEKKVRDDVGGNRSSRWKRFQNQRI